MVAFLRYNGPTALSEFRRQLLAAKIGAVDIQAYYVHYIATHAPLDDREQAILRQLLEDDDVHDRDTKTGQGNILTYYASPRIGTISPWSSKATSIAHVCGFETTIKRVERGFIYIITLKDGMALVKNLDALYDRMTQTISTKAPEMSDMFAEHKARPAVIVDLHGPAINPREALEKANEDLGLALDASEIEYLAQAYAADNLGRSPFDVELFMFAQVNSEHCRHKQFNADWTIDGVQKRNTLFSMIRNTHKRNPKYVVSAYNDNAAVLEGRRGSFLAPSRATNEWIQTKEQVQYLIKVETHNHPTAVSPFPGASTGSGGEIRDEGAVGRGSRPKAGLCGFSVSDLNIPGFQQPWELDIGRPNHIASSLDIMLEAPIGSAAFNNEFGRPCTTGYFRTLLTEVPIRGGQTEIRGYHKPIMLAGGVGTVREQFALKDPAIVDPGAYLIILGGPSMLIGLGGGAASSVASGEGSVALDFASVQRGNPEVQRRAQEVINACVAMGANNPIKFIHDVGAGGLSNALPELVHDIGQGAVFELREINNSDSSMSVLEIWCCEAQERYVMAVAHEGLNVFKAIADRERCGYSVVGKSTVEKRLVLNDRDSSKHPKPIDLPMQVLFGKPPKMSRVVESRPLKLPPFDKSLFLYLPKFPVQALLEEAINRVLTLPAVGSKSFLITIGDRTVGGLTARDQMVGPWQIPVSNVSVTCTSLTLGVKTGEAMAVGEKPIMALISPAASARMAIAESLLNLTAADLLDEQVHLSANWMVASSHPGEAAALYEAVEAAMKLCLKLKISIPVGKDSMSMKMKWTDPSSKESKEVTAPLSLVVSAFAPVSNINKTWVPALRRLEDVGETVLLYVDLAEGRKALGGSALAQVFGQVGDTAPDVHDDLLRDFFDAMQQLREANIVLAYHDRSDGGLFTTIVEMMFAGRCGVEILLDQLCETASVADLMETLFNEELGALFQVRKTDETEFHRAFATCGPPRGLIKKIGRISATDNQNLYLIHGTTLVYKNSRAALEQRWASTSHHMQRLRDNPVCADTEYSSILDDKDPGLSYNLTFKPSTDILPRMSTLMASMSLISKPRVAILREQGVNGHSEMAFAFMNAGFSAIDVHMTDIISDRIDLSSFVGLAACGGFSYGDVLGAGQGWSKSVLLSPPTRAKFQAFFERNDTFTLGVCNGCQFLSRLKSLIPGASTWPTFQRNTSEQYEARVCMVELIDQPTAPSVFLHGMAGSAFPIATAHGEGRAHFSSHSPESVMKDGLVSARYVDNRLQPTERYPANPNGSPMGITGVRTPDGRVLAMMPHPERTTIAGVGSWIPDGMAEAWGEIGPWGRIFASARRWVG